MEERIYHPILTLREPHTEELEQDLADYLTASYTEKKEYLLLSDNGQLHIMAPFNYWIVADDTIPKGVFLAAVKYTEEAVVKYKTRVLEGQLNKAYDYKTGKRVKFGEGVTLTHYMPLPLSPLVMVGEEEESRSTVTREAELTALSQRLDELKVEQEQLRSQRFDKGQYFHMLPMDSPEFVACRDEIALIVEKLKANKTEQGHTSEKMAVLFDSINKTRLSRYSSGSSTKGQKFRY